MNHLDRVCSEILPGKVRLLFCDTPFRALAQARYGELAVWQADSRRRFVAITWQGLPSMRDQLAFVLLRFAELSQVLYPAWAQQSKQFTASAHWRAAAQGLCQQNRPPLVKGCAPAAQLNQLAQTLGSDVVVLFVVDRANQPHSALAALTRTVEWTARNTEARVAVILPSVLRDHSDLQRIAYRALCLDEPCESISSFSGAEASARDCSITCWPVEGRPHGLSPGEQQLALAIKGDAALASRFSLNQRVQTVVGSVYSVDLLWPAGRVVVEIDGYAYHSDRETFAKDRQRDYELLISGYRVVRLTHDEVWLDVSAVVSKIHRIVEFVEHSCTETR